MEKLLVVVNTSSDPNPLLDNTGKSSTYHTERENYYEEIGKVGDTHSETGVPARLPVQVAGQWGYKN